MQLFHKKKKLENQDLCCYPAAEVFTDYQTTVNSFDEKCFLSKL